MDFARRSQNLASRGRAGAQRQQDRADRDMTPAFRRLLTLKRDTRAATAVEFALLITPLIMLILASLQLSIIFYAGQVLESSAMGASRQVMTGVVQTGNLSATQYKNTYVCPPVSFLFNCNNIMVDVQSGSSYAGINTAPITLTYDANGNVTNNFNYSTGNPGDIVIVRVMYNWPVVGGPLLPGLSDQPGGNHLLMATSVFKTEPY
jgi:Flp pilus assembly protein TadG